MKIDIEERLRALDESHDPTLRWTLYWVGEPEKEFEIASGSLPSELFAALIPPKSSKGTQMLVQWERLKEVS